MALRLSNSSKRLAQHALGLRFATTAGSSGKAEPLVKTHYHGEDVLVITINRPEKRNCVNPETAKELVSAFRAFEEDERARVAVLTGSGGFFCGGFDLDFLSSADKDSITETMKNLSEGLGPMVRRQISPPVLPRRRKLCARNLPKKHKLSESPVSYTPACVRADV